MRLVERALALISKQLEGQADPLLLLVPREQLLLLRADLEAMYRALRTGGSTPQHLLTGEMARTVMYDWPFTILGSAIVEAERAFKECQQNEDE